MNAGSDPRQQLSELTARREALELEADALHNELTSSTPSGGPPPGLKAPLIDIDGYPRGDIDIVNVLEKRQRLAIINTDHKALMKDIERTLKLVHDHLSSEHGPVASRPQSDGIDANRSIFTSMKGILDKGMALIDEVSESSPAMAGGLQCGDVVLSFGPVSSQLCQTPLALVPKVVQENMNKAILVRVQRSGEVLDLHITPAHWNGRGVLGCHLKPI